MTKYPLLHDMEEVTEIGDELEAVCEEVEKSCRLVDMQDDVSSWRLLASFSDDWLRQIGFLNFQVIHRDLKPPKILLWSYRTFLEEKRSRTSLEEQPRLIGGRRVADAIVVSAILLLYFIYLYLIGYIDRGGSKAGSSGSLDFRDVYICILLFLAAYVWIKFRDDDPEGVYQRRGSNKFEPRIKFPVTRGVGGKSKRIPLGSYDTFAEAKVAYEIAAFYCDKPRHTGRLDLGGGAYFPIPALSVEPNLPYEEKVKQVRVQVLKVYAEFEEEKASRNVPPSVPGRAFEMPNGEGHLLPTSPIQQLRQPLNLGMVSTMQGQGSQLDPNIYNGIDFNNPGCFLPVLAKTQQELLDAHKQIECLKAQVSQTEVENMGWEVKYSELEQKFSELERENGLLNRQIMQSQFQTQHQEQEFDTNRFLSMEHAESLAR